MQPSIPHLTRLAFHRCLQRHGISRLPDIEGDKPKRQRFKRYPIGFFHIDIAEVQTAEGKLYLFVGIDRTSKFAVTQLVDKADRRTAWEFLEHLLKAVPYRIHTILTDNGIQFAEQPRNRNTAWSRQMRLDLICEANNIEHRLTKPIHPKAMITILPEADWNGWLTSSYEDVISLQRPYLAKRMRVRGPVF